MNCMVLELHLDKAVILKKKKGKKKEKPRPLCSITKSFPFLSMSDIWHSKLFLCVQLASQNLPWFLKILRHWFKSAFLFYEFNYYE